MKKHIAALKSLNLLLLGASFIFPSAALADSAIYQDCLLEGKVVAAKSYDGENIVRVDFYKAQPYKTGSRCIIDGVLVFKQPKGSLIENLSEGAIVQYHYIKTFEGKAFWQLVGAVI